MNHLGGPSYQDTTGGEFQVKQTITGHWAAQIFTHTHTSAHSVTLQECFIEALKKLAMSIYMIFMTFSENRILNPLEW